MTIKSSFTGQEWKKLLQAPGAAGIYIMMADPSFVLGSMKEALAVSSGILAKEKESNCELLSALLAEFKEKEMLKQAQLKFEKKDLETIRQTSLDALSQAAQILDQKATPEEAAEIKDWLYDVSVKAANAAREGGFLGFGGTKVSDKEKVALQEVADVFAIKA
ncbi:MAG TPA: hypothetical protein ENK96_01680 [Desulfobulbaceae bacterium]|nr:hypothetical protein [Desulfobulbaceae bacterium]